MDGQDARFWWPLYANNLTLPCLLIANRERYMATYSACITVIVDGAVRQRGNVTTDKVRTQIIGAAGEALVIYKHLSTKSTARE